MDNSGHISGNVSGSSESSAKSNRIVVLSGKGHSAYALMIRLAALYYPEQSYMKIIQPTWWQLRERYELRIFDLHPQEIMELGSNLTDEYDPLPVKIIIY